MTRTTLTQIASTTRPKCHFQIRPDSQLFCSTPEETTKIKDKGRQDILQSKMYSTQTDPNK